VFRCSKKQTNKQKNKKTYEKQIADNPDNMHSCTICDEGKSKFLQQCLRCLHGLRRCSSTLRVGSPMRVVVHSYARGMRRCSSSVRGDVRGVRGVRVVLVEYLDS
jgi:hypothetical protein